MSCKWACKLFNVGKPGYEEYQVNDKATIVDEMVALRGLEPLSDLVDPKRHFPESALGLVTGGQLTHRFREKYHSTIGCAFLMASKLVSFVWSFTKNTPFQQSC